MQLTFYFGEEGMSSVDFFFVNSTRTMVKPRVDLNIALIDQILSTGMIIEMSDGGDYEWLGRGMSSNRSSFILQINLLPPFPHVRWDFN